MLFNVKQGILAVETLWQIYFQIRQCFHPPSFPVYGKYTNTHSWLTSLVFQFDQHTVLNNT